MDQTAVKTSDIKGLKTSINGKFITLHATTETECKFLLNADRMLMIMANSGFTPELRSSTFDADSPRFDAPFTSGRLTMEYLGESQPVTDKKEFRHQCRLLLMALKSRGVIHGDLTRKNIIVRDNKPYAIDFQQSRLETEPGPDKRPEGDSFHLWQAADELSPL